MRVRALAAGLLLLALLAVVFSAGAGRGSPPSATAVAPPPVALPSATPQPPAMPARNVFEYANNDEAPRSVPERLRPPASVRAEPLLAAPAPREAVRLVGFVRRSGGLKAALAVHGSVYVVGEGEGAEGYVLLGVDEDVGVRITAPDGSILTLPPPS